MARIKVLVADDHPAFREGVCRALADTDDLEVVASADNGEQAVSLARELAPDVAVVGVSLPPLDGIAAAEQIKEACPDTGVIMISYYTDGSHVLASLRAGALGYLLKTSPLEELISSIRRVRAGETVFDSRVTSNVLRQLALETGKGIGKPKYLHPREIEVLKLVATGKHNSEVAAELHISEHTVHTHLTNIFRKLGVSSRTEAVTCALKKGWLTQSDLP